jgi:hypothetical protein
MLLTLVACERSEPTSYLIPKEEPNQQQNEQPQPSRPSSSASATQAPTNEAQGGMQVLPGMQQAANEAGELSYTVPEGWEDLRANGIRKANLKVSDANGSAELTVLVFPGDVGGRLANINRWRGQIALEAASPDELPAFTKGYMISQHRGLYVRLEGEEQSILGALLPFHGNTWFFKLIGDNETVFANEANMKAFLDSVQLQDSHH